jgi:hypothetical protein
MISNPSAKSGLTLLEQWPVKAALPQSSVMVATGDGRVLVGDQYQDGCLLLDLNNRSCTKDAWPQPERIALQVKTGYLFPEKGIRDLSVSSADGKTIAAVAAKGQYASCWQVGSDDGWVLDGEAHAVAVAPHASSVAVGLGKWVLDSVTPAQAEVVIWDIPENEALIRRKLPGACVVQLLWIQDDDGLIYGNFYNATKNSWLNELIIATTITRDQRKGFVVLLDPVFLRILEIADIAEACRLRPIAAWPQERRLWAGGFRDLDESFHDPWLKPGPEWAPRMTAIPHRETWLSEDRLFRLESDPEGRLFAQLLEPLNSSVEEVIEEIAR